MVGIECDKYQVNRLSFIETELVPAEKGYKVAATSKTTIATQQQDKNEDRPRKGYYTRLGTMVRWDRKKRIG